jgi:hypothetical protein
LERTLRKPGQGWDDTYVLSDMLKTVKIVWSLTPAALSASFPDCPETPGLPEIEEMWCTILKDLIFFLVSYSATCSLQLAGVAWRSGKIKVLPILTSVLLFWDRAPPYCPSWPWTHEPPAPSLPSAGITCVCHYT